MKKIAALFTAVVFSLTLGIVSAEEGTMPWQEKEATPLLKDKKNKEQKGKKKEKSQKKRKAKKKKKEE